MKDSNYHFKLNWTKIDVLAIAISLIIAIGLSIFVFFMPSEKVNDNAKVVVYYDSEIVAKENLFPDQSKNQTDPRYIIMFPYLESNIYDEMYPNSIKISNKNKLLGDLIIEIKNGYVQIVKETSPNHICSNQGSINKVNVPLTCAPNYVIVRIESAQPGGPDIIL